MIIPVFLGADLNCYNMARAFHEAYGVKSYAFGKYEVGATKYSKIINFKVVENLDNDSIMVDTVNSFAREKMRDTRDAKLVLTGCTDDYAAMIIRNKNVISSDYIISCPSIELYEKLSKKADFYEVCKKYDIPFPKTRILEKSWGKEQVKKEYLGFDYPIFIKPSSSVEYWKHPFDGMKKGYVSKNEEESIDIISEIFASGYNDKMVLQELIEGDDSYMRVLTAYSDKNGKVRMMCLGHVLLEEHTPKGIGNHAAIITEKNTALCEKFKDLLEEIGYTGFSNFDLKFDSRDSSYRAFEVNLRQGRSNYYVTAAGFNLAELIVRDAENTLDGVSICENEHYWHVIPNGVVNKYVTDENLKAKVNQLIRDKKETSSLNYKFDLKMNPLRWLFVKEHMRRHYKKFKLYYPVKNGKKQ